MTNTMTQAVTVGTTVLLDGVKGPTCGLVVGVSPSPFHGDFAMVHARDGRGYSLPVKGIRLGDMCTNMYACVCGGVAK